MTVTLEHQLRARAGGACQVPRIGTPLHRLTQDQLAWTEGAKILTPAEIRALWQATANEAGVPITLLWGTPPLTGLAREGKGHSGGYGSGYGTGHGYGYGSSYGSGSGHGYGYGTGYGSGSGYGSDLGYGLGDGSGLGYGYGVGYGYGDGYGVGPGYGEEA